MNTTVRRDGTVRNPLQFVHVPRCGGNTIKRIIGREYGRDGVFLFGSGASEAARLAELQDLPREARRAFKAFSGHIPYGLDAIVGRDVDAFAMLRHPVDRITSCYYFVLTKPGHPFRDQMLDGVSNLDEFVTRSPAAPLVNNAMVRFLGGDATAGWPAATERHFDAAADRIRDGRILVGVHERFVESVALFEHTYGWRAPAIEHANKSVQRVATAELSPETVALIEAQNGYDLALHDLATAVFAAAVRSAGGLREEVRAIGRATQWARWRQAPRAAARSAARHRRIR